MTSVRSSGARRGGIPTGLFGMLALVVLVERFVTHHHFDLAGNAVLTTWRMSAEAVRGEAARAEVLCFGDSLVKFGVLPRVLEDGLHRTTYNLANPGAQPVASYAMLRRALDCGARPQAIIVDFYSKVLAAAPRINARHWPELLTPRELLELSWTARDPRLLAEATAAALLPSYRNRDEIRGDISAAVQGEDRCRRDDFKTYYRNGRINRGALVIADHAPPPHEGDPEARGAQRPRRRWAPARGNPAYIRRFLDLAHARGLTVFWILPPTTPEWQGRLERRGEDAAYLRLVRSLQPRYPNVVVIDGRHAGYRRDVFHGGVHLNRTGAAAFSAVLAATIAPYLSGAAPDARWIRLPDYRDLPAHAVAEDLFQSARAVQELDSKVLR